MAAITTVITQVQATKRIRSAAAQASTGQTDWIATPSWASYATFIFNLTAVGGTTPIFLPSLLIVDPITKDDSATMNLAEHPALTGLTAAAMLVIDVGPGVSGTGDDTTNSATVSSYIKLNAVIPQLLGIKVLNDRTTGDETYTYTVTSTFRN